jgi:hypothetical protein
MKQFQRGIYLKISSASILKLIFVLKSIAEMAEGNAEQCEHIAEMLLMFSKILLSLKMLSILLNIADILRSTYLKKCLIFF